MNEKPNIETQRVIILSRVSCANSSINGKCLFKYM